MKCLSSRKKVAWDPGYRTPAQDSNEGPAQRDAYGCHCKIVSETHILGKMEMEGFKRGIAKEINGMGG